MRRRKNKKNRKNSPNREKFRDIAKPWVSKNNFDSYIFFNYHTRGLKKQKYTTMDQNTLPCTVSPKNPKNSEKI